MILFILYVPLTDLGVYDYSSARTHARYQTNNLFTVLFVPNYLAADMS